MLRYHTLLATGCCLTLSNFISTARIENLKFRFFCKSAFLDIVIIVFTCNCEHAQCGSSFVPSPSQKEVFLSVKILCLFWLLLFPDRMFFVSDGNLHKEALHICHINLLQNESTGFKHYCDHHYQYLIFTSIMIIVSLYSHVYFTYTTTKLSDLHVHR